MKLICVGVGGSGAACTETLTHLSALGLLPDGWNLIPVMVDQDQQHPRITATTRFIDRYLAVRAARRATTLSGQGLFGLSISRVVGSNVLQPSTHESLFDLLGLADSRQAKAAARDKNVMVHGAYTAQRGLEAGVLDELQIHQIPVLFGGGLRLFEVLPARIELEIIRVIDTPEATHIRYRVRHE